MSVVKVKILYKQLHGVEIDVCGFEGGKYVY